MSESDRRTALLISGGGSTAQAVIEACQSGELRGIVPVAVIASSPTAGGLEKARALGIETHVVERDRALPKEAFGDKLLELLQKLDVDLISQNGWMPLTPDPIVEEYAGRIINQHPGPLDPGRGMDFGGKGMYGARVLAARLAYVWATGTDESWTEATTHFVTPRYDEGDLIRVARLDIPQLDRPMAMASIGVGLWGHYTSLQPQLLPLEHENVIATLNMFGSGDVEGYRRETPLVPAEHEMTLNDAKALAIQIFPNG